MIPNGVIRRRKSKTKGQKIYKTLHRKLKIEQDEPDKKGSEHNLCLTITAIRWTLFLMYLMSSFWVLQSINPFWKESLNIDGQQFYQYQQNQTNTSNAIV